MDKKAVTSYFSKTIIIRYNLKYYYYIVNDDICIDIIIHYHLLFVTFYN